MKRFIFPVIIMFALFSIANINQAKAADKKMAASGGLGITYPMGDMGDVVKFPMVPLLLSFQYAVMPFLSLEADIYYYLLTSTEDPFSDYSQYQFGVSARYWLTTKWKKGKSYDGIYFGGGLARTNVEVEVEYTVTTYPPPTYQPVTSTESAKGDDDYTTLVLKGGYIYPLKPVLLDLGIRYDAVDMEFGDAGITLYAMASYLF